MSSYTIAKVNYIRVAGTIAGISKALYRDPLWIYNHKDNRNFNENDYYNLFSWVYDCNAKSVQLQYNDPAADTDINEYMSDFEEYKKIGEQAVYHGNVNEVVKKIAQFFDSINYQIEDDTLSKKVSCYLNIVLVALAKRTVLQGHDIECWGSFELSKPDTEIIDIMDMIK